MNKFFVNVTFAAKGGCDDSAPGLFNTNRRPELRVVKLSKLSHSKLHEIPEDFICDDRLSLTEFELNFMGCNYTDICQSRASCTSATLEKLPDSLGSCKNLEALDLQCNNLATLPPWLGSLSNLRHLDLQAATQGAGNHPLVEYPAHGSYPELLFASLGKNNFHNLGLKVNSFADMPKLTHLEISKASLTALPESLGNLENLRTLDASSNDDLKQMPASIGNLRKLVSIDLKQTSIKRLPSSFGKLHQLSSVILSDMNLTALPDSFCSLEQATSITLEGNDLEGIPECFHELPPQVEKSWFKLVDIFSGCRNIRLKYNHSNAGHRSLRKRLGGIWRKKCSCAMTLECFCNNNVSAQPECAKSLFDSACDLCSTRMEQEICLSSVDEVNMTSVL